jgi:DNA primase
MSKRFSSKELYKLRNSIPIHVLIETELGIPAKISEGVFRFLCPLCNEFQTAVNPKTNLSRCFRCEKNFNTIDLVMTCRRIGFVDSVKYLQTILNSSEPDHDV